MNLSEIVGGCGPQEGATMAMDYNPKMAIAGRLQMPTLAQRVAQNIAHHEQEIAKLREIETLLSENPQIEKLISALGNVNIRY